MGKAHTPLSVSEHLRRLIRDKKDIATGSHGELLEKDCKKFMIDTLQSKSDALARAYKELGNNPFSMYIVDICAEKKLHFFPIVVGTIKKVSGMYI